MIAGQRGPEIERTDQAVQRGAERQLDKRRMGSQHGSERPHRGRFGRPALATDEHAADDGMDGVDEQRLDQLLLADDRRQRVGGPPAHTVAPSRSSSSAR